MQRKLFSILQYVFFLGMGLFLVWWQLKTMSPSDRSSFYEALSQANYWLIIPASFIMLLSHLSRSMRWKLLMRPLNYHPPLSMVFAVTMIGYLANSAIPRLGEILKCSLLARYEKLRMDRLFGTILVERIFDFLCFILFIGLTILIQLDTVDDFINKALGKTDLDGKAILWRYLLLTLVIVLIVSLLKYLSVKFPDSLLFSKIHALLKGMKEGITSILSLQAKKAFLIHTLVIWALYLLQIFIGFYAMPATSALPVSAAFSVLSLATVAMIITPGGIGSFPIFVMQVLALYQVDDPVGKAFGWLMWGVNTAVVILAGCISLLVIPYLHQKNKRIDSSVSDKLNN
jgi:uncharacterized protein (TIRG00374 family)